MKKAIILLSSVFAILILLFSLRGIRDKDDRDIMFLTGNIEVVEVDVGFKIPGRAERIYFEEGERVKRGQVLARLENIELKEILRQQETMLEEAEIRLLQLKKGSRQQEVEQARANVDFHEAELRKLEKEYERTERLFKEGVVSQSYLDNIKAAYEARVALYKKALQFLDLLKEGPREEEVRIAEKKVEEARVAKKIAQERLEETILRSPIDGIIMKKNVEEGEIVAPGVPLFTIGDLQRPWVKVYVPEDKIGHIKLGQKALVSTDSYKGKFYEGKIGYISKNAEFTPKTVQTKEERVRLVFAVKISVRNENDELKPGMPADVRIIFDGR